MQPPDALPGTWQRLLALSGVAFAVLFLIGWFAIVEWVAWFNNDRLHESLADLPRQSSRQALSGPTVSVSPLRGSHQLDND